MDEEEAEEELMEQEQNNDQKVFGNLIEVNSSVLLTNKNKYCLVKKEIDQNMYECLVKTPPKKGSKSGSEETEYLMLLPKD